MSRQIQTLAATASAVDWEIYRADEFNVPRVDLTFSAAPTSPGYLYVKKDSGAGDAFDSIIRVFNPIGYESVSIEGMHGLSIGDKLVIEYANPDGVTVTGSATVDIPLNYGDSHLSGMTIANGSIRSLDAVYRNCQPINLFSADPGASGATYEDSTSNYLGGMRLNAATDKLQAVLAIHNDWDRSTNPVLLTKLTNMVDNTSGNPTDILKFKFVLYYGQPDVPGVRTQTFYAQGTVGQLPQYTQLGFSKEVDRDAASNALLAGDTIYATVNLEADSDITDVVLNCAAFYYNTTHVGFEAGDE